MESVSSADGLRSRGKVQGENATVEVGNAQKEANASLKLSAYLNLFGDFSESLIGTLTVVPADDEYFNCAAHNITDGLVDRW